VAGRNVQIVPSSPCRGTLVALAAVVMSSPNLLVELLLLLPLLLLPPLLRLPPLAPSSFLSTSGLRKVNYGTAQKRRTDDFHKRSPVTNDGFISKCTARAEAVQFLPFSLVPILRSLGRVPVVLSTS